MDLMQADFCNSVMVNLIVGHKYGRHCNCKKHVGVKVRKCIHKCVRAWEQPKGCKGEGRRAWRNRRPNPSEGRVRRPSSGLT